jgi:hypothetical protein
LKEFLADSNNSLVIISFLVAHIMGGGATQVVRTAMGVCVCARMLWEKNQTIYTFSSTCKINASSAHIYMQTSVSGIM